MFGKDKVKGHNRIIKGKSGFKVTRIGDFLRKKDDNRKRNLAIGATAVLGIGAGLLLRKKGIKLLSKSLKLNSATANTPKYPKGTTIKTKSGDMVVKKDFSPELDPWEGTYAPVFNPWNTPINVKNKINTSFEMLVNPKPKGSNLLSPAKDKVIRSNMRRKEKLVVPDREKVISSVVNMRDTQKNYDSLPLDMKATFQIEKLLRRPIREGIGRPPDTSGLKTILDVPKNSDVDTVVKKATRKITTRLKGQAEKKAKLVKKKQLDDVISSPSRRAFLKKVTPKLDKDATLTKIGDIIEPKSSMGKIIRRMNNLAKDPEVERLGIKVRDDEWEKALRTIAGRREMMLRTKNGLSSAAESLVYTRVVKPKIIKSLMGELNSGRLSETNPKGYAQRLKRIEENLADLFKKEGVNYKRIGRRELMTRTARIMEPEINDTARKMKDFATDPATLTEVFYGNPELSAGLKMAGIKDKNMIKAIRLLMFLGAGPG